MWGGEEACYQSKYILFFHVFPSFTLTAPLLAAVKPPSVKASILAPAVGTALRAVIFLQCVMGLCFRQIFLYYVLTLTNTFILYSYIKFSQKAEIGVCFFKPQMRPTLFE